MSQEPQPHEADDPGSNSLDEALGARGIDLPDDQRQQLDRYRQLLWEWNTQLNLTRHTTFDKFAGRDVVDSLQLAEHIPPGARVLDLGSGGGVPGIVLAICRPDLRVTLCESTQKKARVLHAMVEALSLSTPVAACRAEELLQLQTFDIVVARAVAPLEKILTWLAPYWDAFDVLLLIKGKAWTEERGAARHRGLLRKLELRKIASYESPIGESHVLKLWRRERRAGRRKKRG